METTQATPPALTQLSPAARFAWAALILATLYVCYFSHLGALGFVGPDEPRYAWIARDMAESGDWVTPRLYGKPWFEKPVLYYWAAAFSFKLFGVSEAAARLPSALAALFATLALAWLALRLYGAETARWLLLLLPTTVGMIGFSHAASTDMPFTAMLTIAMICAAYLLRLVPSAGFSIRTPKMSFYGHTAIFSLLLAALFGFFLGLAVLAKGPAALILSGGAVFFWALFTKRWRDAFRLLHPAAIASFCLTALPWYILCARRNPGFLRIFIIEHNFKRYLTPEFQHIQPFWFYVPVLLVAFLPWTAILLWSTVSGVVKLWRTHCTSESTWFLVSWAAFCVAFFSISLSKLPGYILPAFPPIALLIAHDLNHRLRRTRSQFRWLCLGMSLTLVALGVAAGLLGDKIPFVTDIRPSPAVMGFLTLMISVGIAVGVLALLRRVRFGLSLAALALPAYMAMESDHWWELDEGVSARPAAARAVDSFSEAQLQSARTYKLQRGLKFGLDFYFHRELAEWSPPVSKHYLIFTTHKGSSELEHLGVRCFFYIAFPAVETCVDSAKAITSTYPSPRSRQLQ